MFKWYAGASVCFAQIEGYQSHTQCSSSPVLNDATATQLGGCRWFSRGWTLQELIAPPQVHFYDDAWVYFGVRCQLSVLLSTITGIDRQILDNSSGPRQTRRPEEVLRKVAVSKKMSWAASRQTKRVEDRAYSLLGLFGVSMPMLYGEGERAFIRLQEEIMRETDDMTIFAWCRRLDQMHSTQKSSGILARSPEDFATSNLISSTHSHFNPEYAMTNKGVQIKTQLRSDLTSYSLFMSLNCRRVGSNENENLGILLQHQGKNVFSRANPHQLFVESGYKLAREQVIYLQKHPPNDFLDFSANTASFLFDFVDEKKLYDLLDTSHSDCWSEPAAKFSTRGLPIFSACVRLRTKNFYSEGTVYFIIAFGHRNLSQPWVAIAQHGDAIYTAATAGDWDQVEGRVNGSQMAKYRFFYYHPNKKTYNYCHGLNITAAITPVKEGNKGAFVVRVSGTRLNTVIPKINYDGESRGWLVRN